MCNALCSVIIPAYNAEKTIERCLQSFKLYDSAYLDLEVIVVNDGSKDGTKEIAENYFATSRGGRVIDSPNRGVSSARNIGLKEAKGKWVFFCDADDVIIRNTLDEMIKIAEAVNCDILVGKYAHSDNVDTPNDDGFFSDKLLDRKYIEKTVLSSYVKGKGPTSIWKNLYKLDVITSNRISFDEARTHGEDYAFNIDFFCRAQSMYVINDIVYIYNYSPQDGFEKYGGNIGKGLIDDHKRIMELNDKYGFYEKDSYEIRYAMKRFICLCIGYLEHDNLSKKRKKEFLRNWYVSDAIEQLIKLEKNDLPGWNWKNHIAMRLLKIGNIKILMILHYGLGLNLIPNYSKSNQ